MFKKKDIQSNNQRSKRLYNLIKNAESRSALDYTYWEAKLLYQINNSTSDKEFERNFLNLFILSKNNKSKNKSIKLYYLRNIPRFSKTVKDIVMSN